MMMNDGQVRYICPQCGVKYKKMSALKGHFRECGTGAQCPLCPKVNFTIYSNQINYFKNIQEYFTQFRLNICRWLRKEEIL